MPMRRRRATSPSVPSPAMGSPSISTRPEVGSSSRFTVRSRLDFPAPERPMMPTIAPAGTAREMSSRARTSPPADR